MKVEHDGITECRDENGFDILYEAIISQSRKRFALEISVSKWASPDDLARFLTIYAGKLRDRTAFIYQDTETQDQ